MAGKNTAVEAPESYPTLKPAMRLKTSFVDRHSCGDIYTGSTLVAVPLLTNGGIIESVGDFEPKCKFTIVNSIDYFTVDADKSHGRVDAQGALVDEKGRSARVMIDGVIKLNEDNLPLVYNQPDARSSPWDHGIEFFKFQTGHPEYKALEDMRFAGSVRFTYVDGVRTGIEARISQIIPGTGMD